MTTASLTSAPRQPRSGLGVVDRANHVRTSLGSLHPALAATAAAALLAYEEARSALTRAELEASVGLGADGTTTMRIDAEVERAIIDVAHDLGVNVLSEEAGWIDEGSAVTLVVDPLDGSANASAGVPLACFSAAIAIDHRFTQSATVWMATGDVWAGSEDGAIIVGGPWATTRRTELHGAAVSLLRPHAHTKDQWSRVTERAARVRILSCTTLEAMLVLQGSTDAFVDAGSDTHRLVDLAAAAVLLPLAGGVVSDVYRRPIEFTLDLTRRWSGIVAATPALADEIAAAVQGEF